MDTHDTPRPDKQITIDVPADRVPEFYAFYGRFLAGRRRSGGPRGHGRCGQRHPEPAGDTATPAA